MRTSRKWILLLFALVIVFVVDFPILTVAFNSFRTTDDILSSNNLIPTLILFLFIQKYMISGATAGAVKG